MTPQDRKQFQALLLRQKQLENAMAQLRADFNELELRAEEEPIEPEVIVVPPPLPPPVEKEVAPVTMPPLPPLPVIVPEPVEPEVSPVVEEVHAEQESETPLPQIDAIPLPEVSVAETETPDDKGGLEIQFGRWLARIGVVFALLTLIVGSTMAYNKFHHLIGPWSKLTALALVSTGLIAGGLRIERKDSKLIVYGRTLAGGGLACLYYTLYGATYVAPLQVIHNQLLGGVLLLGWSAYVLYLAEMKKSELLSVFAIALAYFSSAITPVGDFTMAANLILSITAVIFLIRNSWTGLSYLCLAGTYVGLMRQFVVYDSANNFWFELAQNVSFWPCATYLAGAWIIYTAGIFLAVTPRFAGGKRMAFLCLNNGALAGLILVAATLSGFGHVGAILCVVGGVFIATSYLAKYQRADSGDVAASYLMQGLALATGGMVIAYSGVTRGMLITIESVFLAAAGAYSRNIIMRIAGYLSAFLGVAFLLAEINPMAAHPYVLITAGAVAMVVNAWMARRDFWNEPREIAAQRLVAPSAFYVMLAVSVLGIGLFNSPLSVAWASSIMAVIALVLTFSVYLVPLFELPQVIQLLFIGAVTGAVIPLNDSHSLWNELIVGFVTMSLIAWWPRQKTVRIGTWLQSVLFTYSLAMVAICACAVHPLVNAQGWMICASLLSLGFLLYGVFARTWSFAAAGQIFLAASIYSFMDFPEGIFPWTWEANSVPMAAWIFPWTWWAAAVPIATTFFTAWLVQEQIRKTKDLSADSGARQFLRAAICVYQAITVALIVRLVFGVVPDPEIPLCFYALGTALMAWNLKWPSAMGLRCAMVLDLFGTLDYLSQIVTFPANGATWLNSMGMLLLLAQPVLLRRWATGLISRVEIIGLTLLANFSTSVYVYWVIRPHVDAQGWMIAASLLSLVYLGYGALTRTWQFMVTGQVYLALAVWTYLVPPTVGPDFPWTWWAAAIPPAVVFATGWLAAQWLPRVLKLSEHGVGELRIGGAIYKAIALGLVVRWIFGIVPAAEDTVAFFLLATGLLIWNVRWPNSFGARAALMVDLVGIGSYITSENSFSWVDSGAFLLFLTQPAILRHWGRELISEAEGWFVILLSTGIAWYFVSHSIDAAGSHNMTLAWAIFALVVTMIGFISNERRQRWCGLIILLAAIIRVGVYDFWGFSDLYKFLTFLALTVITLGLSFLYYKFADRLKEWL